MLQKITNIRHVIDFAISYNTNIANIVILNKTNFSDLKIEWFRLIVMQEDTAKLILVVIGTFVSIPL